MHAKTPIHNAILRQNFYLVNLLYKSSTIGIHHYVGRGKEVFPSMRLNEKHQYAALPAVIASSPVGATPCGRPMLDPRHARAVRM